MTLNIDLEDVPFAILETVKARILANRRRLQQDQQRPRPSLRPKPQSIKQGASSKGWRLPKQAAMVLEESGARRLAHCGLVTTDALQDNQRPMWAAFCGDFTSRVLESTTVAEPDIANFAQFVLPVQGETCILVMYGRVRGRRFTSGAGYVVEVRSIISRAWVCSLSTVRRISVPSGIASVLSQLNGGADDTERNQINGVDVSPFPPRSITEDPSGWQYYSVESYDPSIFEFLNKISPFVSSSQIKKFPTTLRPIIEDVRYSWIYLSNEDQASIAEPALYYSEWLGPRSADVDFDDPSDASLIRPLPESTTVFPSSWKNDLVLPPQLQPAAPENSLLVAWDWDDPDYCRQMCLALGFSAADLQP